MTARLFPFPQARRVKLIRSTAAAMADALHDRGERTLAHALERQRISMERKGFDAETIAAELSDFERAVRGRVHTISRLNGGAV